MPSANNNQTIDTTGQIVFNQALDGGPCVEFTVGVRTTALNGALVNIPGLHKTGEFMGIPVGAAQTFSDHTQGVIAEQIQTVEVKGDGGDTIVDYGVASKNIPVR